MNIKTKNKIRVILLIIAIAFFIANMIFLQLRTYEYDSADQLAQSREFICGLIWKVVLVVYILLGINIRKHRDKGND